MTAGVPAGGLTSPLVPNHGVDGPNLGVGGPHPPRSSVFAPSDGSDVQPRITLLPVDVLPRRPSSTRNSTRMNAPAPPRRAGRPAGRVNDCLGAASHGIDPVKPRDGAGSVRRTKAVEPSRLQCGTRRAVIPPGPSAADGRIDALMFDRALASTYERRPGSPRAEARSRPATTARGGGVEAGWSGRGYPRSARGPRGVPVGLCPVANYDKVRKK